MSRKRDSHDDVYQFSTSEFLDLLGIKDKRLASVEFDSNWSRREIKIWKAD